MNDRTPDGNDRTPEEIDMTQRDDESAPGRTAEAEADTTSPTEVIDSAPGVPATGSTAETDTTPLIDPVPAAPMTATWTRGSSDIAAPSRPRVRIAAIVWGVLVMAFAACAVTISASPEVRRAVDAWQASLTPAGWAIFGVVALGVVVLLIAGTSAIRRAHR